MKCPICNVEIENNNDALQQHLKLEHIEPNSKLNVLNLKPTTLENRKDSFFDYVNRV